MSKMAIDGELTFDNRGHPISGLTWSHSVLTPDRVWGALARAYTAEAAGWQFDHVKLLVNGELINDPRKWPSKDTIDTCPSCWRARQTDIADEDDVFLYARGVQRYDPNLFRAIIELLEPHIADLGLSRAHVEAEVFYGAYKNTPGGIHREGCTNLHLVLSGRKRMHFWQGTEWIPEGTPVRKDADPEEGVPEEYLPGLQRSSVRRDGHSLEAIAGKGFFWRSGIWHIGEVRAPAMALNIASYTRTLDVKGGALFPWGDRLHGEVPVNWLSDYRAYVSFQGSDAALLGRLTALGMRPTHLTGARDSPRQVRCVSNAPVVWLPTTTGRLIVAALGHTTDVSDSSTLRRWLNTAVVGRTAVTVVPDQCRGLAEWLCAQQILEPTEE